jgi:hypothetical protein
MNIGDGWMIERAVGSSVEIVLNMNKQKPARVLHADADNGFLKTAKRIIQVCKKGLYR